VSAYVYGIVPLTDEDRTGFSCGNNTLDTYFLKQARQDMRRRVAACYVMVERETGQIAGYYTLSACHVYLHELSEAWRRKLPRYPIVPAVRLERLAVDLHFQGKSLAPVMLANAVSRALRSGIAANVMLVDAKDDRAAAFYEHHGFQRDPVAPLRLYAPLSALAKVLRIQ